MVLAREVHSSRRLSLVVAGLVALLPSHIHYAAQLLTESLHTAFVLGAMIITFRLVRRPNWAGAVLLGIIIGLGVYIRPVLLFFPMIVGILLVIYQGSEKVKSSIALTVIVGVVALATILPWTARNYFVMREPILTSTNGGYNFFIGNGPRATGLYRRASDDTEFANFSELDWHKEGYRLGLENVVRHPVEWVSLLPKKFYFLWAHNLRSVVHYLLTGQYRTDPVSFGMVVSMLCWVALGVTAIVALFTRSLRNYWLKFPAVLLLLMLVYWTGFHMLVFGVGRFSMQMGPVLAIIGVHLLDGQRDWRSWLSPRMS